MRPPSISPHAILASGAPIAFEGHGARRPRVGLDHVQSTARDRVLDVDQADHAELERDPPGRLADLGQHLLAEAHRRDHAGRVARVHPGLLYVLHDPRHQALMAVREGIDVDLDRVLEEAIEQQGVRLVGPHVTPQIGVESLRRVADLHRPPAEHVGRAHEEREPDLLGDRRRLRGRVRGPVGRVRDLEAAQQGAEATTILGQVDRVDRRPEQGGAGRLELAGELERRLAAELDDHPLGLLDLEHGEHVGDRQGLEVEAIGGVVIGRHRLRVAVHHHRVAARLADGHRRVHAAVVELDALPDPVRARAEDDDGLAGRARLVLLAPRRVEVVRAGLDFGRAGVHAPVDRPDAPAQPRRANLRLACVAHERDISVGPARAFQLDPVYFHYVGFCARATQRRLCALELGEEPGMDAFGQRIQARPRCRGARVELAGTHRLEERLRERPPDPHRLADRLHLRPESLVRAGELLEGEARELDDDVVERRLEARGRRPGEVVRDLVERVAHGELGRDLRDRVAGRLARQGGRAGNARVHLDHTQLAGLALARELDVGPARLDPHSADDGRGRVSQLLVGVVRERHLWRDGDRVARVNAHRIEILDRAHDDDVVVSVPHDLELELVPADQRLLDEDLADGALA